MRLLVGFVGDQQIIACHDAICGSLRRWHGGGQRRHASGGVESTCTRKHGEHTNLMGRKGKTMKTTNLLSYFAFFGLKLYMYIIVFENRFEMLSARTINILSTMFQEFP